MGITTVSGEALKRAQMASALCKIAKQQCPLCPLRTPILDDPHQPKAPQAAALKHWPHDRKFASNDAVEFLRRTIADIRADHPAGHRPLTNVGLLLP